MLSRFLAASRSFAALQFSFDGCPNEIEPYFFAGQSGIHAPHGIRGQGQQQAFGPKLFPSHGGDSWHAGQLPSSYLFVYTILRITYIRYILRYMDHPSAIVIQDDLGGTLGEYIERRGRYIRGAMAVRFTGKCASSCTILLSVPGACVMPTARLGFHLPSQQYPGRDGTVTGPQFFGHVMLTMYPAPIRKWLDERGGLSYEVRWLFGSELRAIFKTCQ